jgi:hypothetical protein
MLERSILETRVNGTQSSMLTYQSPVHRDLCIYLIFLCQIAEAFRELLVHLVRLLQQ